MSAELRGQSILVPPGLSIKPTIDARFPVNDDDVGELPAGQWAEATMRLEYSASAGRYVIAAFGLDQGSADIEISGTVIRSVRVQALARGLVEHALPMWAGRMLSEISSDALLADRRAADYVIPHEDLLLVVALAYRVAQISNENPAQAVAETLGMQRRTATNWIRRARDAGHMTEIRSVDELRRALGSVLGRTRGYTAEELDRFLKARPEAADEGWSPDDVELLSDGGA